MDYLHQTTEPLFPNMVWSRPETRRGAGKLLVIGGQAQEFNHVATCFTAAEKAGAGTVRVIMPESTQRYTQMLPNIEYAAANSSGSFSRKALAELLDTSQWADGVVLSGNLGKNSETSLLLESFIAKYSGLLVISSDALPSLSLSARSLFERENTLLVLAYDYLRRFGIELALEKPVTSSATNAVLARILHELGEHFPAGLIVLADQFTWTSQGGQVAATKKTYQDSAELAGTVSVWAMQQPNKIFEAITTAVYC